MRSVLTLFSILFSSVLYAQTYDNLIINDKKEPDRDNKIFVSGRTFFYDVETEEGAVAPNQVLYSVLNVKNAKRTNKGQTEVVIAYLPDNGTYENTGIVENIDNLWLHPPRSGFFKALETCPFPYVSFPLKAGMSWKDQLKVGEYWSEGKWTGSLLLDIEYRIAEKNTVTTETLEYDCWVIESTANSRIGASKATFLYNESIGFIEMHFQTMEGETIRLKLKNSSDGPPLHSLEEFLMNFRKSK